MSQTNQHPEHEPPMGAAADESQDGDALAPTAGEDPRQTVAEHVAALAAEVEQLRDERLRALAEVENVRRRASRDVADARSYAVTAFARDTLSVADNLARAIASVGASQRNDPALAALLTGVEMTEKELQSIFERYGIRRIEALGKPFDPNIHEALFELPEKSVAQGTVVQVIQDGYLIHDRPLRPARVGVSRGGPPRQTTSTEATAAPADTTSGGGTDAYDRTNEAGRETPGGHVDETT